MSSRLGLVTVRPSRPTPRPAAQPVRASRSWVGSSVEISTFRPRDATSPLTRGSSAGAAPAGRVKRISGAALGGGQVRRGALGDDPAGGDDRHPVGQRLRLVHVVGGRAGPSCRPRAGRRSPPRPGGGRLGRSRWSARPGRPARGRRPRPSPTSSRRRCPPDRGPHPPVGRLLQPDRLDHLVDLEEAGGVAGELPHGLAHGQGRVVGRSPGARSDQLPRSLSRHAGGRVHAQHARLWPAVRRR